MTAAPSDTYLAMVTPLPMVSSSGWACTSISRRVGAPEELAHGLHPMTPGELTRFRAQSHTRGGNRPFWRPSPRTRPHPSLSIGDEVPHPFGLEDPGNSYATFSQCVTHPLQRAKWVCIDAVGLDHDQAPAKSMTPETSGVGGQRHPRGAWMGLAGAPERSVGADGCDSEGVAEPAGSARRGQTTTLGSAKWQAEGWAVTVGPVDQQRLLHRADLLGLPAPGVEAAARAGWPG